MRKFAIRAATAFCTLLVLPGLAFAADNPPPMMAIPGKMGVSATGAFTYTIPIMVPPGTNNIVPALSLDYSSQYGDGTMGMGWTLAGLPTITRCPRTLAQDGVHGSVNFMKSDRFCMNGQRLILVSGTYGDSGSQYRTEIESFSEIIAHGSAGNGPAWFEVHSKNGQVLEFGNSASSALLAVGTTTVRTWAVNQIADTKGNYLTVTYTNDATNGEAYPIEIDYTGNAASSPVLSPYNSVQFTYTTRAATDIVPTYQAGSLQQTTVLLTNIKTYTGTSLVMNYVLAYQNAGSTVGTHSASHDELVSVQQCTGAGTCPSHTLTKFTWQGSGFSPTVNNVTSGLGFGQWASDYGYPYALPGDFNGDGITDITVPQPYGEGEQGNCFYIGTGGGTEYDFTGINYDYCPRRGETYPPETPLGAAALTADFNGDGLTDFLQELTGEAATWSAYISNGSGFVGYGSGTNNQLPIATADYNGDGLSDALHEESSGTNPPAGAATFFYSKGDGTFTQAFGSVNTGTYIASADFDGDGCTDILGALSASEVSIAYAPACAPAISSVNVSGVNTFLSNPSYSITGDFNGDGKADLIDGSGQLWLSTGTGLIKTNFVAPSSWVMGAGGAEAADFNGDGRQDIIVEDCQDPDQYCQGSNVEIWASTGQTGCLPGPSCADGSTPAFKEIYYFPASGSVAWIIAADLNNDGASDAWVQTPSGSYAPELLMEYVPELMTTVTDGLSAKVIATYKPLNTNGSFYTKGTASYPTQAMDGAQYFVSQTLTSNGVGGNYETDYSYAGAQTDLHGRGFLGFTTVTATDHQTQLITTTTYRTDFPYVGAIESQVKTCPSSVCAGGVTLNSVTNSWENVNLGGTPGGGTAYYFVGMTKSVVVSNDLDGSAFPTVTTNYTYDCDSAPPCYGNATKIVVSVPDGSGTDTKTTTNTYYNDATNWLIGRLTKSVVESVLASGSDITRTTKFGYDTGGSSPSGLLTSQIVEPGASDATLTLETDYTLNQFGSRYITTQKGCVWIPSTACATTDPTASRATKADYSTTAPYNGQFPTQITDALGYSETLNYNTDFGTTSDATDANVQKTQWSYDGFGRQTLEIRPDGNQTSAAYTYCTDLPAGESCPTHAEFDVVVRPENSSGTRNGPISVVYYDSLARVIAKDVEGFDAPGTGCTAAAPCWIRVETDYNATGQVAQTSRPYFLGGTAAFTAYSYDALYRVTKATFPDTSKTTYGFSGLATTVTNDLGEETTTTRNPQRLTASVKDAAGDTTTYAYDAFGDLTNVEENGAHPNNWAYDIRGRKISASSPDTGAWSYVYDGFGELASQTDATPHVISLAYDAIGHLVQRNETGPNTGWTYGTDPAQHNVEQLTDACMVGTIPCNTPIYNRAIAYDDHVRPATVTYTMAGNTYAYALTYNTDGRIATVTYPSGFVAQYVYTVNGYLYEIEDASTGTVYVALNKRSAEMQWTSLTMQGSRTTTRTFSPLTGLITESNTPVSGPDIDLHYSFDTIGNLTSRSDSSEGYTENFCYDPLNRLTNYALGASCTASGATTVGYNAIGDITSKSDVGTGSGHGVYTYGAGGAGPHAVTSIAGNGVWPGVSNPTISYNADGNMGCVYTGSGCSGPNIFRDYAYTSYGMVASLTQNSSALGNATLAYTYDDARARYSQVQTVGSDTATTLYFNFGGLMSEQVTDGASVTSNDYFIVDGDIVGEHSIAGGSASQHYFVNDNLGSVTAVLGGGGGVLERDSYDAWGLRRNPNGTAASTQCSPTLASAQTTRGYTNQEMVDSACLVNLNARFYDPLIARMPQPDSVVSDVYDMQSMNRYSYVNNGPLSATDPTGNDAVIYPQPAATTDTSDLGSSMGDSLANGSGADQSLQNHATSSGTTETGASGAGITKANGGAPTDVSSGSGQTPSVGSSTSSDQTAAAIQNGQANGSTGNYQQPTTTSNQQAQGGGAETVIVCGNCDANPITITGKEITAPSVDTNGEQLAANWPSNGGPPLEAEVPEEIEAGCALAPEACAAAAVILLPLTLSGDTPQTGSYTNTHESGKTYSGKGSRARSQASGRRIERETGDPHTATDWTPAENSRGAFKQESTRIDEAGGKNSPNNYNRIESPGKKMLQEDQLPDH